MNCASKATPNRAKLPIRQGSPRLTADAIKATVPSSASTAPARWVRALKRSSWGRDVASLALPACWRKAAWLSNNKVVLQDSLFLLAGGGCCQRVEACMSRVRDPQRRSLPRHGMLGIYINESLLLISLSTGNRALADGSGPGVCPTQTGRAPSGSAARGSDDQAVRGPWPDDAAGNPIRRDPSRGARRFDRDYWRQQAGGGRGRVGKSWVGRG